MAKKPAQMHELLAVEKDLEGTANKIQAETIRTLTDKKKHFSGSFEKFTPFDAAIVATESFESDKNIEISTTVDDKLRYMFTHLVRYWDAILQKEATNQVAVADLIYKGEVIAAGVPATWLLGMETRFKQLRKVLESVPTLDPEHKWEEDASRGKGVWQLAKELERFRTKTETKSKIVVQPTEFHPAQIEKWPETFNWGKYKTMLWSSCLTVLQKSEMLGRCDGLLRSLKQARQRANTTDVVKLSMGKKLMHIVLTHK